MTTLSDLVVVKVGGSLYDLPDLAARLNDWLNNDPRVRAPSRVLLVPGGGSTADAIRDLDRVHGLGDEVAHWLALRALTLNAHFLACLLPEAEVVSDVAMPGPRIRILDGFTFLRADEQRYGRSTLPHSWDATSDSVAARVAVASTARSLVLLKSTGQVGQAGFVDSVFAGLLREGSPAIEVCAVNLRDRPLADPLAQASDFRRLL